MERSLPEVSDGGFWRAQKSRIEIWLFEQKDMQIEGQIVVSTPAPRDPPTPIVTLRNDCSDPDPAPAPIGKAVGADCRQYPFPTGPRPDRQLHN